MLLGDYDKKQLESDCHLHGIDSEWINPHFNIKQEYGKLKKLQRSIGLDNALSFEKMNLEGTHHRGIDDARNISKIFLKYFNDWNI